MSVMETSGHIFDSKCKVLACPVNTFGAMGKGLALEFRNRHPDLYYVYKQQCRLRRFNKDTLMLYKPHKASYKVLVTPTKIDWAEPAPLWLVEDSLRRIAKLIVRNKIASLALPALGCGEGGLQYEKVKPLIYHYLDKHKVEVELYKPHS